MCGRSIFAKSIPAVILLCAVGAVRGEERKPNADWWLVHPAHTSPKILEWAKSYPELVSLDSLKTFEGRTAYAVTVTDRGAEGPKRAILFSQPHAHEPAATAGMMDFLSQLLDGKHLDGRPTDLDREKILAGFVLSFIPDGNPDGRARAPEDWWDGKQYSNDAFLKIAFGREADGRRCKRVGRFTVAERPAATIGIVYERINDDEYVEPNRDVESTYFKLVQRTLAKRDYALMVDIHQTEFSNSEWNAMVVLPFMQKELPEPIQAENRRVGEAVVAAWRKIGAEPLDKLNPLGYREDQLQYFRRCWSDIYTKTPSLIIEVQNNNVRTPPSEQLAHVATSIRASIEAMAD